MSTNQLHAWDRCGTKIKHGDLVSYDVYTNDGILHDVLALVLSEHRLQTKGHYVINVLCMSGERDQVSDFRCEVISHVI